MDNVGLNCLKHSDSAKRSRITEARQLNWIGALQTDVDRNLQNLKLRLILFGGVNFEYFWPQLLKQVAPQNKKKSDHNRLDSNRPKAIEPFDHL